MKRGSGSRSCALSVSSDQDFSVLEGNDASYLTDVDESSHQILVAEGVYRILRLFPGCVFHNPMVTVSNTKLTIKDQGSQLTRIPTVSRTARPSPSTQTVHNKRTNRGRKKIQKHKKGKETSHTTHWRPPSTFHWEAVRHRQR